MKGVFTVKKLFASITTAATICELQAGSGHKIEILEVKVVPTVYGTGEVLDVSLEYMTAQTTGGNTTTPEPTEDDAETPPSGCVLRDGGTGGTAGGEKDRDSGPIDSGYRHRPNPEQRRYIGNSDGMRVKTNTNLSTSSSLLVQFDFRVI